MEEQIRKMYRIKSVLRKAAEALTSMDCKMVYDNGISELERVTAVRLLYVAHAKLEVSNRGERSMLDLSTRSLFPRFGKKEGLFFIEHPELMKLGDFADTPWDTISFQFRKHEIECPLALSKFHAEYRVYMANLERAAAATAPAPLPRQTD